MSNNSTRLLGGADQPDDNNGPKLLITTLIVTVAAFISVCLRIWVRKVMTKSLGWDDFFICASMLISLVCECLVIPDVYYGAGRHAFYLTDHDKQSYGLYLNFISQPFFLVGVVLVKVSIGIFLLRLTPSLFFQRFIKGMIGFMALYTTIALIPAVCFSPMGLRACAYFNANLVFALIPIPILWNVKINRRVKLAIVGILSLGLFATAACIVKVYFLTFYGRYNDFLWDSVNLTIWTSCELNIAIFAASIATLRPLFRVAFRGDSSYNNSYTTGQQTKSLDKHGFVKHISNSGGASKVGRATTGEDEDFEMYDSVVTAKGKRRGLGTENTSEESILPVQNPGIMKTTQVEVLVDDHLKRKEYDSSV